MNKTKQLLVIRRAEYFAPLLKGNKINLTSYGFADLQEDPYATESDRAFLLYTNEGKKPTYVNDLVRFISLVIGLQRMTLQMKLWTEGFLEGTLFLSDFDDEPDYIRPLVQKAYDLGKSSYQRFSYVKSLGVREYWLEVHKALITSN